ncbi:MAG: S8 family serine peptidase [Gammaproteobacteria bacterium]
MRLTAVLLTGLMVSAAAPLATAAPAEYNPVQTRPAAASEPSLQRVIVKFRAQSRLQTQATAGNGESAGNTPTVVSMDRMRSLGTRVRMNVQAASAISPDMQVMQVSPMNPGESATDTLARLRADSEVEYAEVDRRVYSHSTPPNDAQYSGQWYLQATDLTALYVNKSAINAISAWDDTTGSNGVVVAVIDTGVRFDHPDLKRASQAGRLLRGYDFVSSDSAGTFTTANDGDGADTDSSDPGDRCSTDSTPHSSWHGTRVSGIIGALSNNSIGVSGITWSGWILPVRVLGKCGGFNSDVLAGMRWAAGQSVPNVPANPYPAKVLNISLGSTGSCDSASADVISQLASQGVLIVVSAGNEGGPVDSPANCPGAMAVAGLRHAGTKVGYSSLGPQVAISAPAGNCINIASGEPCIRSIDTTTNDGTDAPGGNTYTNQFNTNLGTSFSAPVVSGIAGLMLAVNGNLKSTQLISRLQLGSATFPAISDTNPQPPACVNPATAPAVQNTECICTTATCGAGMANARGAVDQALRPIAAIKVASAVSTGNSVQLQGDGSAAACNHSISTYAWTVVSPTGGSAPPITNASSANAMVPAPTSGTYIIRLTVTDEAGKKDTADVTLSPTSASKTAPDSAGTNACLAAISVPQLSAVSMTATDAAASEVGPDAGTFTFTRTGDTSAALTLDVALTGSATNGTDYQSLGSTVTFPAGQGSATMTVTPIPDSLLTESTETVVVTIQSSTSYDMGSPSSATINIANSDVAPAPSSQFSNGGGGGGSLDWLMLAACLFAVMVAALARNTRRGAVLRARRRAPVPSRRRG